MKKLLLILSLGGLFMVNNLYAQVTGNVSIENVSVTGTDVFFDVYVQETPGSSGPIYLGNADFYIFFDPTAFSNPQISVEENPNPPGGVQGGYCSFTPTNAGGTNNDYCRLLYYTSQSTVFIANNELAINLNGAGPGTQVAFDNNIAKIDNQPSTHRLGTYKLTGYNNTPFNLTWDTSMGFATQLFTLADSLPFYSSQVNLTFTDSPLIGTSSNEETEATFGYTVFPNPANEYLTIEVELVQETEFRLFDVNGRVLETGLFTERTVLETAALPSGTYFLRLTDSEGEFAVEKVVVTR